MDSEHFSANSFNYVHESLLQTHIVSTMSFRILSSVLSLLIFFTAYK